MDIRQLRYFVAIVEAKSFSKAASTLRVAQPALSLHVRNIEAELGTDLLLRTPQGVFPTETGLILFERARAIIAEFEAMKRAVSDHEAEPAGEVRLGLPGTIGEMVTVPLILETRRRYPKVRLKVQEAMSGFVLEWLYEGRVDIGLLYTSVDERGLKSVPVLREDLLLFASAGGVDGAPPPGEGPVSLAQASGLPLVLPGPGHGLRTLVEERVGAEGLQLSAVYEVDSYAAIKALVSKGLAYSILPFNAVAGEAEAGRFHTWVLGEPPLSRRVHLVHAFDRAASRAASAVEALCRTVLADLVRSGEWKAALVADETGGLPGPGA